LSTAKVREAGLAGAGPDKLTPHDLILLADVAVLG